MRIWVENPPAQKEEQRHVERADKAKEKTPVEILRMRLNRVT
jgi:hypothetical protein